MSVVLEGVLTSRVPDLEEVLKLLEGTKENGVSPMRVMILYLSLPPPPKKVFDCL